MAKSKMLLVGCSLLVLFSVCFGEGRQEFKGNECQIDRLTALEPTNRIEAEGGVTEFWDSTDPQFRCSGVTVMKRTIQPNGLLLPSFTSAPELVYIERGRGLIGLMIPGCPETFESISQQSWQGEEERGQRSERGMRGSFQDQHQKVRRFRQGDVIALQAGIAHWVYNDGDEPMVDVILVDTSNNLNQLDQDVPRRFYLAGKPQPEQHQGSKGRRGQRENNGNIFSGFETRLLAESFGVSEETARKLQCEEDDRGNIILVHEGLQVIRPPRRVDEREERQSQRGRGSSRGMGNGVEETMCSARIIENLDDPERADIYTPHAGRISTLNNFNLPILQLLRLSAEKGNLYRDAIMAPLYNLNAHDIMYCLQGRARIQIVNDQGNQVFDDEVSQGQLVVVPQNFAVVKQAREEGFEWISFKTSENAMFQTLAGRTSAIRAMPLDVISNIYQIPREQAQQLKYGRPETTLFRSRNPQRQGRALDA
ncbi:11S globulin seed storage protein 1-like [Silene latifolia]|uniref:11S globulin seed storage protein 1-like n=1 Tax=Silene latifolia TaxID=37657 RepID=UPI003D7777C9